MNDYIRKYEMQIQNIQEIRLPRNAEILSIISQRNKIVLYAFIDYDIDESKELFDYYRINLSREYAGNFTRKNYTFAGTLSLDEGFTVIHAFYRKIREDEINPKHLINGDST